MKVAYLQILFIQILLFSSFHSLDALNVNDTIKPIPFIEKWDSGTFSANAWRFPYMQGHWTIVTNQGDSEPCASFPGLPATSNYINALVSPWFDATGLTCDNLTVSFNLKLTSLINSGTERLTVILQTDSNSYTLNIWSNDSSFNWKSFSFDASIAHNRLFRIQFITSGFHSEKISAWYLDNISITRQCRPPKDLISGHGGWCGDWGARTCKIYLAWQPPLCNGFMYNTVLYFDDGSAETGYRGDLNTISWFGSEFPVSPTLQGVITNINVYFGFDLPGPDSLTIDIFDENRVLIGSSSPFLPPYNDWVNVPVPNISFTGKFYAMVKWNNPSSYTNYLGFDEDGPHANLDLEWYFDGTTWLKTTQLWGLPPNVGLMHVAAIVNSKKDKVILDPGHLSVTKSNQQMDGSMGRTLTNSEFEPDSSQVIGYLVYRDIIEWDSTGYQLITPTPISDTSFIDTVRCRADYYIKAVYADGCLSLPSNSIGRTCDEGQTGNIRKNNFEIKPNPASDRIEITSDLVIQEVDLINLDGSIIESIPVRQSKNARITLYALSSGMYFVSVVTANGVTVKKLIVNK